MILTYELRYPDGRKKVITDPEHGLKIIRQFYPEAVDDYWDPTTENKMLTWKKPVFINEKSETPIAWIVETTNIRNV